MRLGRFLDGFGSVDEAMLETSSEGVRCSTAVKRVGLLLLETLCISGDVG
jgi:hypothetical protein